MSIMASQRLQGTRETIEPVTLCLGFYTERMKLIISPLKHDVIHGKNWKNKHKATTDCSNNDVPFNHAVHQYIIHANETIKESSLESLVNDYKNGCPMFSVLLRNENENNSHRVYRNAEFSAVLSEYTDVFPEELPKGLRPKRANEDLEMNSKKDPSQSRKICIECLILN